MFRQRLLAVFSFAFLLNASADNLAAGEKPRPPNIVFIIADDLGVHDLACYGRTEHRTPSLDRLAKQGLRFTSAYAAQSVCSPTRAAIMTGKSPARLHLTTFLPGRADTTAQLLLHPQIQQHLPSGVRTIADLLRVRGYISALIGKWHLGGKGCLPTDRGFDFYHPGKALTEPSATEGGKGEYDLTIQAEKFIEAHKDRPFFLCLAHNNPHIALSAKPELTKKHKNAFNPEYAAMIETLDDCVGRVMAKLDSLGLAENTLVIFTSDNGGLHVLESPRTPATHNGRFRSGKGFLYQGGLLIPLLVVWKGKIPENQAIDVPVISTDWTPTWLAAAGIEAREPYDGVNLLELFTRGRAPPPRTLFWHQPHYMNQGSRPAGAALQGSWKLIEHYEDGRCELFDLAKDPGESTDLGAKEAARVADLRGQLEAWRREVRAQANKANPHFNGALSRKLYHDVDVSRLAAADNAALMAPKLESWRTLMNNVLPSNKAGKQAGAGAVVLHARDAKVHGGKLRHEPQPHKDTLGYWVHKDDWAEWTFDLPKAGKFEVQVLQACGKGCGGAEVDIRVGGQTVTMQVEETGHFQRFVPRTLGTVDLKEAGRLTLTVRARTRPGPAVMDLRQIVLRDAP